MTTRRWTHPLWVHVPAAGLLALMCYTVVRALPLPARVPVHYGLHGAADRIGSPWEVIGVVLVLCLLYLAVGVLIDEDWARSERRKSFNWLSLFDELTIAPLAVLLVDYLQVIKAGGTTWHPPLENIVILTLGSALLAAWLEHLRPWTPRELPPAADPAALRKAFAQAGDRWVYWEAQNPAWFNVVMAAASLFLLFGGLATMAESVPAGLLQCLVGVAIVLLCGGLRTTVTPARLEVRVGFLGLRLLRLPLAAVAQANLRTFSPLRDFGGYGIRYNGRTWAFYLRGNQGVQLVTAQGRQFLLGSDTPERLAAAIEVARKGAGS